MCGWERFRDLYSGADYSGDLTSVCKDICTVVGTRVGGVRITLVDELTSYVLRYELHDCVQRAVPGSIDK